MSKPRRAVRLKFYFQCMEPRINGVEIQRLNLHNVAFFARILALYARRAHTHAYSRINAMGGSATRLLRCSTGTRITGIAMQQVLRCNRYCDATGIASNRYCTAMQHVLRCNMYCDSTGIAMRQVLRCNKVLARPCRGRARRGATGGKSLSAL